MNSHEMKSWNDEEFSELSPNSSENVEKREFK